MPTPAASQTPPPEPNARLLMLCVGLWLLGWIVLFGLLPIRRLNGALLIVGGSAGVVLQVVRGLRLHQWRLEQAAVQEQRDQLRETRQTRRAGEKQAREQQRDQSARQRERTRQQQSEAREQARSQAADEAAQRQARQAQHTREAERLTALDADALTGEIENAFAAQGWRTERVGGGMGENVWLLNGFGARANARAVARLLLADRIASVADVQALEARRQENDADSAFLIAFAGFSPQAVRLAPRLPLTLVDPFLLAAWKSTNAATGTQPTEI